MWSIYTFSFVPMCGGAAHQLPAAWFWGKTEEITSIVVVFMPVEKNIFVVRLVPACHNVLRTSPRMLQFLHPTNLIEAFWARDGRSATSQRKVPKSLTIAYAG